MRKFLVLMLVMSLFASVFVASAQDEEAGTIADIVVASATGDSGEFATLLAAVQAADPAVLEALSDPEAELTVFAPTNAAFEALGADTLNAVLADTALLTDILLFHVVDGAVYSTDVVGLLEAYEGAFSGPTLNGQFIDVELTEEGGITIDGANLVLEMVDIEASNGVIHVIDAVILPETRTIAEIVSEATMSEAPEFTVLLTAVGAADPAVLELLSNPESELTVFAPTDAAFTALIDALGQETFDAIVADTGQLTDILMYHVLDGVTYSTDLSDYFFGDMMDEEMAEGEESAPEAATTEEAEGDDMMMMEPLEVIMADGSTATISYDEEGNFYINDAMIVLTDIDAGNGVIHVIDAVLVPSGE